MFGLCDRSDSRSDWTCTRFFVSQCPLQSRSASVCGPKPTQPLQPGVAPSLATTLVVKYTRRCPDGPWSCCVTNVAVKFSALPYQGSPRTFLKSLITNLSSGGTRCNDLAFWTSFSVRTMCSSVIGAFPTQIMAPPLIQIACRHGRVLVHHSFSECQLARVRFPKNTHKGSSPVVFSLGTSSGSKLRDESATLSRCCHSAVFLAGSRAMSHQRSLDSSALHSPQRLYQQDGNGGFPSVAAFSGEPIGAKPSTVSALQLRSKVSMSSVMDLIRSCKPWRAAVDRRSVVSCSCLPICAIMRLMRCCKRCSSTRYAPSKCREY